MTRVPLPTDILFSIRTGRHRTGDLTGAADPGLLRLHDGFVEAWLGLGHTPVEVPRPEIYSSLVDRRTLFGRDRPLHVLFKPTEDLRVLKGACNVGCLMVEEPRIRSAAVDGRPFSNHLRMLRLLDEVWVGSAAVQRLLVEAGLGNVRVIPCPGLDGPADPTPGAPPTSSAVAWFAGGTPRPPDRGGLASRGMGSTLFVATVESTHPRFDPETLIRSFLALPDAVEATLLILSGSEDAFDWLRSCVIAEGMAGTQLPRAIGVVSPSANPGDRTALYGCADFIVCTSRFEDGNGRMLDAMAQGCIPIAPRHSAITDLLTSDHPLLIASAARPDGLHQADGRSCTQAMAAADAMPAPLRASLSTRARRSALQHRSIRPLADRLLALTSPCHA